MSDLLDRGRSPRVHGHAQGNRALLVMVDSRGSYHDRCIVQETVLVALEHFGMPLRLLDLALERPSADLLAGCAGLVIGQYGLGEQLSETESRLIAGAVAQGMGLVNFDGDLRGYRGPLLEVFGFQGVERLPYASNLFLVPSNEHYITWLHEPRAFHESPRMVTAVMVKSWRDDVTVLCEAVLGKEQLIYSRHVIPGNAYEPKHYPIALAARWGQGRAVQWLVNPRLWRQGALGHTGGLDDLFWRSIVWTARKPFVAHMIPPFVTMSFDDCAGRHDFRYLDICTQHGYVPLVGLYLDYINEHHREFLQRKSAAGEILVNTHGGRDYYDRIYYDLGVGEYSTCQIAEKFAWEDDFYRWLGVPHCRTVRGHFGEIGVRALPHLKERGRTLLCTPIHIGEHRVDQFPTEGYWPYDSLRRFYDRLPDDEDFYIFGSFNERHLADFLTGSTIWLRESTATDIEKAATQAAEQVGRGLRDGFFGEVLTHEQKFAALTLEEWDRILSRAAEKMARHEMLFAHHDDIGRYLRERDGTWLSQAHQCDGAVRCTLSGRSDRGLLVSLFVNADDGVERRLIDVAPFEGRAEITCE